MRVKRLDTWVKERTWFKIAKYRYLTQRERQMLDVLLCMPGIDTESGWCGSVRKIIEAYKFITTSCINWEAASAILGKLTDLELLVCKPDGRYTRYRIEIPERPPEKLRIDMSGDANGPDPDRVLPVHGSSGPDRVLPVHDEAPKTPPCTPSTQHRVLPVHATVYPEYTVPLFERTILKNLFGELCSPRKVESISKDRAPDVRDGPGRATPTSVARPQEQEEQEMWGDIALPVRLVLQTQCRLLGDGWLDEVPGRTQEDLRTEAVRQARATTIDALVEMGR